MSLPLLKTTEAHEKPLESMSKRLDQALETNLEKSTAA